MRIPTQPLPPPHWLFVFVVFDFPGYGGFLLFTNFPIIAAFCFCFAGLFVAGFLLLAFCCVAGVLLPWAFCFLRRFVGLFCCKFGGVLLVLRLFVGLFVGGFCWGCFVEGVL